MIIIRKYTVIVIIIIILIYIIIIPYQKQGSPWMIAVVIIMIQYDMQYHTTSTQ